MGWDGRGDHDESEAPGSVWKDQQPLKSRDFVPWRNMVLNLGDLIISLEKMEIHLNKLCIFIVWVVLGLHGCVLVFFSCGEQRLLFFMVCRLLSLQSTGSGHMAFNSCSTTGSGVVMWGPQSMRALRAVAQGPNRSGHVGSSWTRDWTHVPCIGRWVPIHWTTREVLETHFWKVKCPKF